MPSLHWSLLRRRSCQLSLWSQTTSRLSHARKARAWRPFSPGHGRLLCSAKDFQALEEETLPGYTEQKFYPVSIGDLFHDRYKVIGKLGYGTTSTVWLCHDVKSEAKKEYVMLKIFILGAGAHRETSIYNHLDRLNSDHYGYHCIRKLLNSFKVQGPHGTHTCLVHEALGMNLEELKDLVPGEVFGADLTRQTFRDILRTLHFLREEARVVHTDIQRKNILLGVLDNSAFARFEDEELQDPFPRKELPSRTIYISRPMHLTTGAPKLCDFSEARLDDPQNTDPIMPDVYRAPEVILGLPWSYTVDIWSFAMTLWDLFEPKRLFFPSREYGHYSAASHLAQMISIMGPPPHYLLERSPKRALYWDEQGHWLGLAPIPDTSLDTAEQRLQGNEKALFLAFMRKMLQWRPEDRSSIEDIFTDEWLLADLIESGEIVPEH